MPYAGAAGFGQIIKLVMMTTLTLHCSAVTVHPNQDTTTPPLVARVIDVEPEEVLEQIEIKEIIRCVGVHALLEAMTHEQIKDYLNP